MPSGARNSASGGEWYCGLLCSNKEGGRALDREDKNYIYDFVDNEATASPKWDISQTIAFHEISG